jgi:hypothetical protein
MIMKSFLRTILFLGFVFTPFIALAVPDIPHQFYGTVNFSNGPAPDGLIVEARTSIGTVVGVSTTKNGKYGYSPNLFFVTDDNDGTPKDMLPGQEIKFFVNGIDTGTTALFSNGGYSEKNLVIGGAIGIISKSETEVISNQTIAVSPQSATTIKMGDSLNITVSSIANTNAIIEKIEKLSFGNVAVFSGKNLLNAFDIKITGENLNILVTMKYSDAGIDEDTIIPYWFNTTSNSWVAITDNVFVDKNANTITFTISSGQTTYAVFGQVPTPSGGGGATTPTPTPTPLSAQAQKVDANKDNKIDILDFNSLMVSWGSTIAGTIADFNGDNKVDIFDFNLLMIYWTG